MTNPSPVPPLLASFVSSNLLNSLNSLFLSSSLIPRPVSYISIWSCLCSVTSSSCCTGDRQNLTCPLKVNLRAFPSKLIKIYFNLLGSVHIVSGVSGSISKSKATFLITAFMWRRSSISFSKSRIFTSSKTSLISLPQLISV